jgi:hypothetical protein
MAEMDMLERSSMTVRSSPLVSRDFRMAQERDRLKGKAAAAAAVDAVDDEARGEAPAAAGLPRDAAGADGAGRHRKAVARRAAEPRPLDVLDHASIFKMIADVVEIPDSLCMAQ